MAWSSVAAAAPSVPTGHQPQTREGTVTCPSVSARDPSERVIASTQPSCGGPGRPPSGRPERRSPSRHSLHSVLLWGSCVFLRIFLGDHITATAGTRRGGVQARGHALGTCTAGDSCPRNWAWGGGAAPLGGTPGSSSQDQALPWSPVGKLVLTPARQGGQPPAQSSSSPPLGRCLHRRASAQTRASGVRRDGAGGLNLPPRHPLPSSPAGGTGSGSSGGWNNRDEDTSGRRLSDGQRLQDGARGQGPPPSRGRSSRAPCEGRGLGHPQKCPLLLSREEAVVGLHVWPGVKAAGWPTA